MRKPDRENTRELAVREYFTKFNNLPIKISHRWRALTPKPFLKMTLEQVGSAIPGNEPPSPKVYSNKRIEQTTQEFFDEVDRVVAQVLTKAESASFLPLTDKFPQLSDEQWPVFTDLSQRIYDALVKAGYKHFDLWT